MGKKCIIEVNGGLGKNVMLTSILPELKKKYDEIYVISPYFDVFKCCPYVEDAFAPGIPTLYQELALDDDCDILAREPYSNQKFIKKQIHLFDSWCEEWNFDLEKPAMDYVPNMDISREFPGLVNKVEEICEKYPKFILVQFCGGQSPLAMADGYNDHQEGLKRNYFKGQELIDKLIAEYPDAAIIHYALKNEPSYNNALKLELPYITYHELAKHAFKVVCTDSSLQHLSTGVCNDVTVIWGETRPEHFGYSCNKNICAKNVSNTQPYFKGFGASPALVKFPTPDEVMEVVKGTKAE